MIIYKLCVLFQRLDLGVESSRKIQSTDRFCLEYTGFQKIEPTLHTENSGNFTGKPKCLACIEKPEVPAARVLH